MRRLSVRQMDRHDDCRGRHGSVEKIGEVQGGELGIALLGVDAHSITPERIAFVAARNDERGRQCELGSIPPSFAGLAPAQDFRGKICPFTIDHGRLRGDIGTGGGSQARHRECNVAKSPCSGPYVSHPLDGDRSEQLIDCGRCRVNLRNVQESTPPSLANFMILLVFGLCKSEVAPKPMYFDSSRLAQRYGVLAARQASNGCFLAIRPEPRTDSSQGIRR